MVTLPCFSGNNQKRLGYLTKSHRTHLSLRGSVSKRRITTIITVRCVAVLLFAMALFALVHLTSYTDISENGERNTLAGAQSGSFSETKLRETPSLTRFAFTEAHEARLPALLRPNESKVTMEAFMICLHRVLSRHAESEEQGQAQFEQDSIPLAVVPIMLEVADNRALICSLDVPIRKLLFVQNGGVEEVDVFLSDIEREFAGTGRVVVHRHPENVGFSGSVNYGIREAVHRENNVTFFLVVNNDVRFPPGLLAARVAQMRELTKNDDTVLDHLESEAAANSPVSGRTKASRGDVNSVVNGPIGLHARSGWSPSGDGQAVTSPLLPANIRALSPREQAEQFSRHTGAMFFNEERDGSAFFLSRLAASVTGYFDDNFYPAYFEDSDYWFRLAALGFRLDTLPTQGSVLPKAVHYVNALRKLYAESSSVRRSEGEASSPTNALSRSAAAAVVRIGVLFRNPPSYLYAKVKWNTYRGNSTANWTGDEVYRRFAEPFGPSYRVPVDVWVRDELRINATRIYLSLGCHGRSNPALRYRASLVAPYALAPVSKSLMTWICVIFLILLACMLLF